MTSLVPLDWEKKNETSLFTRGMWPYLDFFFFFSSSCVTYGPLMLLSHTPRQPTQRLHVSLWLLALIKHSRRETEKVEVFCSSEAERCCSPPCEMWTVPFVLLWRSVDLHNTCQSASLSLWWLCVCSAACPTDTDTSLASPLFLFLISVFTSFKASRDAALISPLTKTWPAWLKNRLTNLIQDHSKCCL